jgi:hypothetical protein
MMQWLENALYPGSFPIHLVQLEPHFTKFRRFVVFKVRIRIGEG